MPCCASPAIASPAVIATAIGRNSGSTIASAASGNSVPSVSTADRNAGPAPGPRPDVGHREQHGDQRGQRVDQQDRHPGAAVAQQLAQLDADHAGPPAGSVADSSRAGPRRWSPPARCARGVRRSGASSSTRMPAATSSAARAAGVVGADQQPLAVALLDGASAAARRPGRRARSHEHPAGGPLQVVEVVLEHQPAAVQHADPGAHLLDLGEQVAGDEDRGAGRVELEQQRADVADALRVEAVGRLVEDQQPRRPQQRVRPGRGAAACRASRRGPGVRRRPPSPTRSSASSTRPARRGPARPERPMASKSARLARPDRCGYAAGPSTIAPTSGSTSAARAGHRPPEHLDRAGGGQHQARAASAPWWSCPSRWRRGSRRRRPRARRGRRRRRR